MEDLAELIQLTSNRIYALRERLQGTLRQDFPSETPQLLGKLLLQLVDKVNDELNQLCSELDTASPARKRTLSRHVRLCACSIRNLAPYLRYVEGARLEHNPWHIVGQFERLCGRIVPHARVIVRPKWKYNYESCWLNGDLRRQVFLTEGELKPIFGCFPNFFALSYTSAESKDFLQYAIWGHEIGHLFFQELGARNPEAVETFSQAISKAAPFDPAEIDELLDFRFLRRLGVDPAEIGEGEREKYRDLLVTWLAGARNRWLSEIFADLFALRLFGPAPLLAFAALPLTDDELDQFAFSHPAPRLRLAEMLKQVERLGYRGFFGDKRIVSKRATTGEIEREVKAQCKTLFKKLERMAAGKHSLQERSQELGRDPVVEERKLRERLLTSNLEKAIPVVVRRVNEEIQGKYLCSPDEMEDVFHQIELLHHDLPPEVEGNNPRCLGLILTAGWLFWTTYGKAESESGSPHEELFERRKRTNRLLSKGIEAATVQAEFEERKRHAPRRKASHSPPRKPTIPTDAAGSGILSAPDLLTRLNEPSLDKKLCITPLLEKDQIQADSIDLRLGNTFLVTRRTTFPVIDVTAGEAEFRERIEQYQRRIYVPMGKPFYIHPGQFVLASSLEFLSMPRDLAGSLVGRTSWGRLGISVPTISKVAPGFKGCLTIEIKNLGEAPVPLYPGVRIAQLRVQTLSREAAYRGRYEVPTSTEFSRIYEDAEMRFLGELRSPLVIGVTGLSKSGCSRVVNFLHEEGFYDQSLTALRRDEMRQGGRARTEENERDFVLELRRNRGNEILAQLLLERLEMMPFDKVVVEGIERLEEVELLAARTKFFLIGIEAPFQNRLKWWVEDDAERPISEEELRKHDLWELYGVGAEGEESEEGAPNIKACMEKVDYKIANDRDKAHVHKQVENILMRIMQTEHLYEFDIW